MNTKLFKIKATHLAVASTLAMAAQSAGAVDLVADEYTLTGTGITMWGFAADTGQACGAGGPWSVGPTIGDADVAGGVLSVNLRNCLGEPVSIHIPGLMPTTPPPAALPRTGDGRAVAMTHEAPAGGSAPYGWTVDTSKPGTYLYQSATHPAKQVQMGLYGAVALGSYPGAGSDLVLLYSEVDPTLHASPAAATARTYDPRYFLVNGKESESINPAGNTGQPTVVRLLNAGLEFHVPAFNKGEYVRLVAEDGNPSPYAKEQASVLLPAGKTVDVLWNPTEVGDYVVYDRKGHGMHATLGVTADVPVLSAADDAYPGTEETLLNVPAPGVLDNDTPTIGVSAVLVGGPSNGTFSLAADGSFSYTPDTDFFGSDTFTYAITDGSTNSNVATVTLNVAGVNDLPVAADDVASTVTDTAVTIPVLDNDTDVDGDALSVTNLGVATAPASGTVVANLDGTVTYTPAAGAVAPFTDTFTYTANDTTGDSNPATVTVTVDPFVNTAPVAVDDEAITPIGAPVTVDVLANDSDADGDALTVGVFDAVGTSGGSIGVNVDNTVTYTPPDMLFAGTDTFTYTANDGTEDSAPATVTVTVNTAPVALDDLPPDVQRNSIAVFIDLTGNDWDLDGNLKDGAGTVSAARITITTGGTTTRGGSLTVVDNGVEYTPKKGFQGTDTFNYQVQDLAGVSSNEATVRFNVTK